VLVTERAEQQDDHGGQDERLYDKVMQWHHALCLMGGIVRSLGPIEPCVLIGASEGMSLRNVISVRPASPLKPPFPLSCTNDDMQSLKDWCHAKSLIQEKETWHLVSHGLRCIVRAYSENHLDFRIPMFVRAAETVLALPKNNGGEKKFAERAVRVLGLNESPRHPLLRKSDLHKLAVRLYRLRNECVHGKTPFEGALKDTKPKKEVVVAKQLEALAETLAQAALLAALRTPQGDFSKTFKTREGAWEKGCFPSSAA
jgi:hypothetical protein